MGIRPRHRRYGTRTRSIDSGFLYLRSRKNIIFFLALFLGGLLFSSIYAARDSIGPKFLLSMVTNHLEVQASSGYWQILMGCLWKNVGFIVFLFFAANCIQGKWLALMVPAFFGLSVGSMVTVLLCQHGFGAMGYLILCIVIPRFLQLILLMAACNLAIKYSRSLAAKNQAEEQHFFLFGALSVVLSLLEALILSRFTGLLIYL